VSNPEITRRRLSGEILVSADYYRNNDLAQRDMDLIIEELIEAGVLDDN